jgi:hypothetical protein
VPVVRHVAIAKQPYGPPRSGLGQDAQKGGIVAVLLEQGRPGDRPIEDVIDLAAVGDTQASGHGEKLTMPAAGVKQKRHPTRPLFRSTPLRSRRRTVFRSLLVRHFIAVWLFALK